MTYRQRVQTQALLKRNKQEAGSLAIFVSLAKVGPVVHTVDMSCTQWSEA